MAFVWCGNSMMNEEAARMDGVVEGIGRGRRVRLANRAGKAPAFLCIICAAAAGISGSAFAAEDLSRFEEEMALGRRYDADCGAPVEMQNRDLVVEHYARALSYRPEHPDNIVIEYRIGVLLSQRQDPGKAMVWRREEALEYFERVMSNYKHEDYYSVEPMDTLWSPQIMVPRAAILAGSIELHYAKDTGKAQDYYYQAIDALAYTYERRREDWLKDPEPPERGIGWGPREESSWRRALEMWAERKEAAERGDIFGENSHEMAVAKASVEGYASAYAGAHGGNWQAALEQVLSDFPDTPMARIAQSMLEATFAKHQHRVDNALLQSIDDELAANTDAVSANATVADVAEGPSPAPDAPEGPADEADEPAEAVEGQAGPWMAGAGALAILGIAVAAVARRRREPPTPR